MWRVTINNKPLVSLNKVICDGISLQKCKLQQSESNAVLCYIT